ncbi:MAG: hypothetical protein LBL61_00125 [Elusimicrobiota bacterium]|nr:hypothetical protein [Elusimicrobiota bacterium]
MKTAHQLFTLLLLLIISAPIFAAAPMAHLTYFEEDKEKFLIGKIAGNEPITYCIHIAPEYADKIISYDDVDKQIRLAFKIWTSGIAALIRKSGREEEFADILNILEKDPRLQKLPSCNFTAFDEDIIKHIQKPAVTNPAADISYYIYDYTFIKNWSGKQNSFYNTNPIPFVAISWENCSFNLSNFETFKLSGSTSISYNEAYAAAFNILVDNILKTHNSDYKAMKKLWAEYRSIMNFYPMAHFTINYVISHETGHAIGLADQYESGLTNADALYATVKPRKSLMDQEFYLTCDDADGIITLMDRVNNIKRSFASLCNDGIKFRDSKEYFYGPDKWRKFTEDDIKTSITVGKGSNENNLFYSKKTFEIDINNEYNKTYLEEQGFNIKDFENAPPKNLYFTEYGYYKKINGKDKSVGEWHNVLKTKRKNKQIVINIFDDEGKQLSSELVTVEENGEIISRKELPLAYNNAKNTTGGNKESTSGERKKDEFKKELNKKLQQKILQQNLPF